MSALSRLIKHSLLLGNSEIIFRQKNVPRQIIYSWTLDPVKAVAYKLHIWKEKYIYFSYPRILSNRKVFIYLHIAWFLKGRNPLIKAHWKFFLLISCRCYFNSSLFPLPFPDHSSALPSYHYHTLLVAIAGTTDLFHFEDNYMHVFVLTRSWIVFPAKLKEEKLTKLCPLSFVFFNIQLGILSTDCTRSTAT